MSLNSPCEAIIFCGAEILPPVILFWRGATIAGSASLLSFNMFLHLKQSTFSHSKVTVCWKFHNGQEERVGIVKFDWTLQLSACLRVPHLKTKILVLVVTIQHNGRVQALSWQKNKKTQSSKKKKEKKTLQTHKLQPWKMSVFHSLFEPTSFLVFQFDCDSTKKKTSSWPLGRRPKRAAYGKRLSFFFFFFAFFLIATEITNFLTPEFAVTSIVLLYFVHVRKLIKI